MRAARIVLAAICALFLSVTAVVAFDPSQLDESERTLQKLRADLAQTNQKLFDPVLTDDELRRLSRSLGRARIMLVQFGGATGRRSPRLEQLAAESVGAVAIVDPAAE